MLLEGQKDKMSMTLPIALAVPISLRTMDAPRLSCFWYGLRHTLQAVRHVLIACIITVLSGGCASHYGPKPDNGPKPDLSSVETIGVVLPEESSESLEAGDVLQLYKLKKGEDTGERTAKGAVAGAAVGLGVGVMGACMWLGAACGTHWLLVYGPGAATVGAVIGGVLERPPERLQILESMSRSRRLICPRSTKCFLPCNATISPGPI